jgi:hypothetical protein
MLYDIALGPSCCTVVTLGSWQRMRIDIPHCLLGTPLTSTLLLLSHQQDKIDESEDKEAILGADILNPTTGLSLKDYLEGREQDHNELIARALLGEEAFKDDHTTYLDSEVRGGCADNATQGSTVQGSTMRCSTAQYGAEWYSMVQDNGVGKVGQLLLCACGGRRAPGSSRACRLPTYLPFCRPSLSLPSPPPLWPLNVATCPRTSCRT